MEYAGRTKRDYLIETISALNALIRSLDTKYGVTLVARDDLYAPPITVDCDAVVSNPILRQALEQIVNAHVALLSKTLLEAETQAIGELSA